MYLVFLTKGVICIGNSEASVSPSYDKWFPDSLCSFGRVTCHFFL